MRVIARGCRGDDVRDVQARLSALGHRADPDEPGVFGPGTEAAVRAFQQERHVLVDGEVGADTWQELVEAGYTLGDRVLYLRYPVVRGDDVRGLQARLNLLGFDAWREDGVFGERTDRALREFQANVGLPIDGIAGPTTLLALQRLRAVGVTGPGRDQVREREELRTPAEGLAGARVAVDAALGPGEGGAVGPSGLTEATAAMALALALVAELDARGARPFLLRAPDTNPGAGDRARAANAGEARLLISIDLAADPDPAARGALAFYCGREGWWSVSGRRLAELSLRALVEDLGRGDGGVRPMWLPLLRETRMPAAILFPAHLTNPDEEALLRGGEFPRTVARAVADAVARFLEGEEPAAEP